METEPTTTNKPKPNGPRTGTQAMTGMNLACLLAPSIFFIGWALVALYYGASYKDMAVGSAAVAQVQKFDQEIEDLDAKIDAGEQEPSRKLLMGYLRKSNAISSSWREMVSGSAMAMQRVGIAIFVCVAVQVYMVLRLRGHYKKLANGV